MQPIKPNYSLSKSKMTLMRRSSNGNGNSKQETNNSLFPPTIKDFTGTLFLSRHIWQPLCPFSVNVIFYNYTEKHALSEFCYLSWIAKLVPLLCSQKVVIPSWCIWDVKRVVKQSNSSVRGGLLCVQRRASSSIQKRHFDWRPISSRTPVHFLVCSIKMSY